jgi:hypothetical protein
MSALRRGLCARTCEHVLNIASDLKGGGDAIRRRIMGILCAKFVRNTLSFLVDLYLWRVAPSKLWKCVLELNPQLPPTSVQMWLFEQMNSKSGNHIGASYDSANN